LLSVEEQEKEEELWLGLGSYSHVHPDHIPDVNVTLRKDLRSQTAFMNEPLQNLRTTHLGKMVARFAQAHSLDANLADAEFPADQIVQPNSAGHYVSARIQGAK
jgi:hypothetical protein